MTSLCRDPWIPWTTISALRPIDPEERGTSLEPSRARPAFVALLWVRTEDGKIRSVPLPELR
jgi:hypothetical protein